MGLINLFKDKVNCFLQFSYNLVFGQFMSACFFKSAGYHAGPVVPALSPQFLSFWVKSSRVCGLRFWWIWQPEGSD